MKEIWVDIKDYEGLYQISNYGMVKSLNYNRTGREEILKLLKFKSGHLFVYLYKNGVKKPYLIHQLVAQHFIQNPECKPIVHHKDHNPANNKVDNLVWLTYEEHTAEHPEVYEASRKAGRETSRKALSKHINQFTIDGLFVRAWYSAHDIEKELGYNKSNVVHCCKGKYKTAYGYIWKYADQD